MDCIPTLVFQLIKVIIMILHAHILYYMDTQYIIAIFRPVYRLYFTPKKVPSLDGSNQEPFLKRFLGFYIDLRIHSGYNSYIYIYIILFWILDSGFGFSPILRIF